MADLDAVGNTTKAITKGVAIGSAVIAAVALFGSFLVDVSRAQAGMGIPAAQQISAIGIRVDIPQIFIGMLITTASLPNGQVEVGYSQTLVASGGVPPRTWSIAAGALPNGLALDPATGAITGTPTAAGNFNFTVRVTDSAAATATKALSVNIAPAVAVATTSLNDGRVGVLYSQTLMVAGGIPPYIW